MIGESRHERAFFFFQNMKKKFNLVLNKYAFLLKCTPLSMIHLTEKSYLVINRDLIAIFHEQEILSKQRDFDKAITCFEKTKY